MSLCLILVTAHNHLRLNYKQLHFPIFLPINKKHKKSSIIFSVKSAINFLNINFVSAEVISPIVQSGEGALQKISRISSDEYRQRLFDIIKTECKIDEPNDDMIDFYSIMIRMDQGKTE